MKTNSIKFQIELKYLVRLNFSSICLSLENEQCPNELLNFIDSTQCVMSLTNHFNHGLSLLCVPEVFYSLSFPKNLKNSIKLNDDSITNISSDDHLMTVSNYISTINKNTLIEYSFNYELHYSKNILHIMKYLLPKLREQYLIFELDVEVMSFFRYLRWKMFKSYLKHTKRVQNLIQQMLEKVNLDVNITKNIQ